MRRAWARSVRGNPRGAEGRGRARLRAGVRARNTEETRETERHKKKEAKRVRRISVGGVLRAGFWRLKRSYYPCRST